MLFSILEFAFIHLVLVVNPPTDSGFVCLAIPVALLGDRLEWIELDFARLDPLFQVYWALLIPLPQYIEAALREQPKDLI